MRAAAIKLERFNEIPSDEKCRPCTEEDIQRFYEQGFQAGEAHARAQALNGLRTDLTAMSHQLQANENQLLEAHQGTVCALMPLLEAALDKIGPPALKVRLYAALEAELRRLARSSSPLRCTLRCGASVAEDIRQIIAASGLSNIQVEAMDHDMNRVELLVDGGTIIIDPAAAAESIKNLLGQIIANLDS